MNTNSANKQLSNLTDNNENDEAPRFTCESSDENNVQRPVNDNSYIYNYNTCQTEKEANNLSKFALPTSTKILNNSDYLLIHQDVANTNVNNFSTSPDNNLIKNESADENDDNNSCDNNELNSNCDEMSAITNKLTNTNEENDSDVEYKLIERNVDADSLIEEKIKLLNSSLTNTNECKSVLYSVESNVLESDMMSYDPKKLVLTVDDDENEGVSTNVNNKSLNYQDDPNNKDDFIDEDFIPNPLNVSNNSDDEDENNAEKSSIGQNLNEERDNASQETQIPANNFDSTKIENVQMVDENNLIMLNESRNLNFMNRLNVNINNLNAELIDSKANAQPDELSVREHVLNDENNQDENDMNSLDEENLKSSNGKNLLITDEEPNGLVSTHKLNEENAPNPSYLIKNSFNLYDSVLNNIDYSDQDSQRINNFIGFLHNLNFNKPMEASLCNNVRHLSQMCDENIFMTQSENGSESEAFIWTETEALIQQHEQISSSGCGATAILNVLKALNFQFDYENVCSKIKINSRIPESLASTTTLAQYLFSRSIAGMNAIELLRNLETVTENSISGRFFAFWPPREVSLGKWLAKWIRKGAVPVALLNLQKISMWGFIPDSWHHQMIFGCDSESIYLTNPLEQKPIESAMQELTSDSVLLVRSSDVIKRFNANNSNLTELLIMKNHSSQEKKRWFDLNVLGQVVSVLRDNKSSLNSSSIFLRENEPSVEILDAGFGLAVGNNLNEGANNQQQQPQVSPSFSSSNSTQSTSNPSKSHISIPASYVPGITLFTYKDSKLFEELMLADELPLINKDDRN